MGLFRTLLDQINRALERAGSSPPPPNSSPPGPTCSSSRDVSNESSLICHNPEHISSWHLHELNQYRNLCSGKECSWIVPFAGNAFLSTTGNAPASDVNRITEAGLVNWNTPDIIPSLFFHCDHPGLYLVGLRVYLPPGCRSTINVSAMTCSSVDQCRAPQTMQVVIEGLSQGSYQIVPCGNFSIGQEGYVKLVLTGVKQSGSVYADVSHAILIPEEAGSEEGHSRRKRSLSSASPLEKSLVKFVSDPEDFHFGRRGPSVHLQYVVPPSTNPEGLPRQVEYFYNEALVPPGQDVIGSYFCAIGFSGGYFGIQVNSPTERRVLFSIWSAYNTDNPNEIPQDYKVTLIRKGGENIHIGEFGNEGSGGQSYLRTNPLWRANTIYKFLVQARPLDQDNTMFTAWFSDSSEPGNKWQLIASWRKPKVCTYLQGLYSFSENFKPEMGHVERQCLFGNQWAWDSMENGGSWVEVTKARFTADASAQKGVRKDVAGGVVQSYGWNDGSTSRFFLRNCGFFNDSVEPNVEFCRSACECRPVVNFASLP